MDIIEKSLENRKRIPTGNGFASGVLISPDGYWVVGRQTSFSSSHAYAYANMIIECCRLKEEFPLVFEQIGNLNGKPNFERFLNTTTVPEPEMDFKERQIENKKNTRKFLEKKYGRGK